MIVGAGFLGLVFGSFAGLVAHRVPRGEAIVTGRSKCPRCGRKLGALENVPLVSYAVLRGRCRGCGERIALRYPLIELASGGLFGLAAWKFGASLEGVVFAAFFWMLVVLTAIDLEHHLLPNKIVLPALVAGWVLLALAALVERDPGRLAEAALGALVFGGFFFLIAFVYPAGMGGGDVKLAFVLGTFLGYLGGIGYAIVGMFLSFFLGALVGLSLMLLMGGNRKMQVPFGPFLALGTIIAVFAGQNLLDLYLGSF